MCSAVQCKNVKGSLPLYCKPHVHFYGSMIIIPVLWHQHVCYPCAVTLLWALFPYCDIMCKKFFHRVYYPCTVASMCLPFFFGGIAVSISPVQWYTDYNFCVSSMHCDITVTGFLNYYLLWSLPMCSDITILVFSVLWHDCVYYST